MLSGKKRFSKNTPPPPGSDRVRNLPNTDNAQVTFEDKGSRFVFRNLDYQDQAITNQLVDHTQFDELQSDPTDRVRDRMSDFCDK